jgi:hypothetical protein
MLFIHPMWDNESQRIGMLKCWKAAYLVHGYGEVIGFIGILVLLGTVGYMIYVASFGSFSYTTWLLLCVPFGFGVVSEIMVQASWSMVARRGFDYDYNSRISSWIENGERVEYTYAQHGAAADATTQRH